MHPLLAITLGDVAGIGPEVAVRALMEPRVGAWCRPLLVGHPEVVARAMRLVGCGAEMREIAGPAEFASLEERGDSIITWNPSTAQSALVEPGELDARAGQAAYDWLVAAARAALAGEVDAVVTAPLNKAVLHLAGRTYPGHTEILAEVCGVRDFAMMLYLPPDDAAGDRAAVLGERDRSVGLNPRYGPSTSPGHIRGPHGLGVAHVTLHTSIRSVPGLLSTPAIREKIGLVDRFLRRIGCESPRIGVCALNPHAGEQGLFGDEESRLIEPAVSEARRDRLDATGPLPADTLLQRAVGGEFDGVVAMYHDQGHIALKLIGFRRAVNVTLGLPIVRTSPSHGTAFDIAWRGVAREDGMLAAMRVAARLAASR